MYHWLQNIILLITAVIGVNARISIDSIDPVFISNTQQGQVATLTLDSIDASLATSDSFQYVSLDATKGTVTETIQATRPYIEYDLTAVGAVASRVQLYEASTILYDQFGVTPSTTVGANPPLAPPQLLQPSQINPGGAINPGAATTTNHQVKTVSRYAAEEPKRMSRNLLQAGGSQVTPPPVSQSTANCFSNDQTCKQDTQNYNAISAALTNSFTNLDTELNIKNQFETALKAEKNNLNILNSLNMLLAGDISKAQLDTTNLKGVATNLQTYSDAASNATAAYDKANQAFQNLMNGTQTTLNSAVVNTAATYSEILASAAAANVDGLVLSGAVQALQELMATVNSYGVQLTQKVASAGVLGSQMANLADQVLQGQAFLPTLTATVQTLMQNATQRGVHPLLTDTGAQPGQLPNNIRYWPLINMQIWGYSTFQGKQPQLTELPVDGNLQYVPTFSRFIMWCDASYFAFQTGSTITNYDMLQWLAPSSCSTDATTCICFARQTRVILPPGTVMNSTLYNSGAPDTLTEQYDQNMNAQFFTDAVTNKPVPGANETHWILDPTTFNNYLTTLCYEHQGPEVAIAINNNLAYPKFQIPDVFDRQYCGADMYTLSEWSATIATIPNIFYSNGIQLMQNARKSLNGVKSLLIGKMPSPISFDYEPFRFHASEGTGLDNGVPYMTQTSTATFAAVSTDAIPVFRLSNMRRVGQALVTQNDGTKVLYGTPAAIQAATADLASGKVALGGPLQVQNIQDQTLSPEYRLMGYPSCMVNNCFGYGVQQLDNDGVILDAPTVGMSQHTYSVPPNQLISWSRSPDRLADTALYTMTFSAPALNTSLLADGVTRRLASQPLSVWMADHRGFFEPAYASVDPFIFQVGVVGPDTNSASVGNYFDLSCTSSNAGSIQFPCTAMQNFYMDINITRGTVRMYAREYQYQLEHMFQGTAAIPQQVGYCPDEVQVMGRASASSEVAIMLTEHRSSGYIWVSSYSCDSSGNSEGVEIILQTWTASQLQPFQTYVTALPNCRNQQASVYAGPTLPTGSSITPGQQNCLVWSHEPLPLPANSITEQVIQLVQGTQDTLALGMQQFGQSVTDVLYTAQIGLPQVIQNWVLAQHENEKQAAQQQLVNYAAEVQTLLANTSSYINDLMQQQQDFAASYEAKQATIKATSVNASIINDIIAQLQNETSAHNNITAQLQQESVTMYEATVALNTSLNKLSFFSFVYGSEGQGNTSYSTVSYAVMAKMAGMDPCPSTYQPPEPTYEWYEEPCKVQVTNPMTWFCFISGTLYPLRIFIYTFIFYSLMLLIIVLFPGPIEVLGKRGKTFQVNVLHITSLCCNRQGGEYVLDPQVVAFDSTVHNSAGIGGNSNNNNSGGMFSSITGYRRKNAVRGRGWARFGIRSRRPPTDEKQPLLQKQ